jgi:hypothetical protein
MTAEQGERWKQRAMELDRKLGWIRHELRMSDHLTTTKRWREEALAMLTECFWSRLSNPRPSGTKNTR